MTNHPTPLSAEELDDLEHGLKISANLCSYAKVDPFVGLRLLSEVRQLRAILKEIVEADDDAIAELRVIGLAPEPETISLTERARAAINQGGK